MCPRGCWQEPVAWPRVLFVSPWARSAACSSDRSAVRSSDRSAVRSMGRLAVSLLSPAAPEASACSAAGIHWALEDLVASCLHHRQWHEVQARSKLVPACLPVCSCPSRPPPARLLHMKSVFVTGYTLCLFPTSCVYSDSQDCSCLRRVGSVSLPVCLGLLLPAPHEVGVCHRLCPVSFRDFVCLFGFARLFVSAPSRLQAASCLPAPHEVGVCHRLCPVSFSNFVCLFGFARLLVSALSRL